MDFNLLKIFEKVAELGSLTKAAKALGHPKSKISRDLVKLESLIESNLLIRGPRGISLTQQGVHLLQSIRQPIEALENSVRELQTNNDEMKGAIKLTAPEDLSQEILMELINEFMGIYPSIRIELYSTNDILDFKEHQLNLALRIGKLKDSNLIQKKVCDIEVALFASNQYLNTNERILKEDDLKHHSIGLLKDVYGTPLTKKKLSDLQSHFSTNSFPLLKQYVSNSQGIATLPTFYCKKEIATNIFTKVLPEFTYFKRSLFVLSPPSKHIPKHVKVFKDYIFEKLQIAILS